MVRSKSFSWFKGFVKVGRDFVEVGRNFTEGLE